MRAIQACAQILSRFEVRGVSRRKRYRRSGPGIAADACTAENVARNCRTRGSQSGRRRRGMSPCDRASCSPPMRRLARQDGIAPAQSARSTPTSSSVHCPIVDHAMSGDGSRCRRRGASMSASTGCCGTDPRFGPPGLCRCAAMQSHRSPLPIPILPDVGRGRPCVVVIERGVEDRDDPAETEVSHGPVMQRPKEPFQFALDRLIGTSASVEATCRTATESVLGVRVLPQAPTHCAGGDSRRPRCCRTSPRAPASVSTSQAPDLRLWRTTAHQRRRNAARPRRATPHPPRSAVWRLRVGGPTADAGSGSLASVVARN